MALGAAALLSYLGFLAAKEAPKFEAEEDRSLLAFQLELNL